MTWLAGSSPAFPSKFGMYECSLVGIAGHVGSFNIGSFISLVRSGMLREAKYGIYSGRGGLALEIVCFEPDP
jgi:hypothetical protein